MKFVELGIAGLAAIAALASAYAAIKLNNIEQDRRSFEERMTSIQMLISWKGGFSETGQHCAELLSLYERQEFLESARTKEFRIIPSQQKVLDRCFSVVGEENVDVDADGDGFFSNQERQHIAIQVTRELNNYEALSLAWSELGNASRDMICEQAGIESTNPIRDFMADAKGTAWWNYPRFEDFLEGCS